MDVAVVRKEDTGICTSRTGTLLADLCKVKCDKGKIEVDECNAFLVSEADDHQRFDGADFERDCIADKRHYVVVRFKISKGGKRTAKFHYYLKPGEAQRAGDPFYLTVVEGKPHAIYIKNG